MAAWPGLVGEDQCRGLRLELPDQLVDVALPGPDRPQRHDLAAAALGRVGDGDRVLVHIEPDIQGFARLVHG